MFPIRDHNPSRSRPIVTMFLIVINIMVYLYMAGLGSALEQSRFYYDYALIPVRLSALENPFALASSMFLHGGFWHLAGNMLFLWIFGDNLEDTLGRVGFVLFYLGCGLVAALAQFAVDPLSNVPVVGASGAIAGVMGGYFLLFPKAKIDILLFFIVFFRIISVPAWISLALWFGLQLIQGLGTPSTGGGVAYWAHAGGFIAGFVAMIPVWVRRGGPQFWSRTNGKPPHAPVQRSTIPPVRRSG